MSEPVRLVIWDLDETFWKGTLTEGGMEILPENCAIVIELAKRGIVSSICSKNDFEPVQKILQDCGIWDYFVMPSIDWQPKGPRVRDLIEDLQLRQPSAIFIDDNPLNLQEAQRFAPEIQISGTEIISRMLKHPSFVGKDDGELTRLNQYKLLGLRKRAQASASENIDEFLRDSNIRVEINYDVLSNLERALELIKRTNQLNFTKTSLPDNPDEARQALRRSLNEHHVHAGLIRVVDRYGDHGYCGIYVTQRMQKDLLHFCFSCRILGMGIETWIYRWLGRPNLNVRGEVRSDVHNDARSLDWIQFRDVTADEEKQIKSPLSKFVRVGARGGCDLEAMIHYFQPHVQNIRGEYATARDWWQVRRDHSMLLRYAIGGASESVLHVYSLLGYEPEDLQTTYGEKLDGPSLWLFSFIVEPTIGFYRHRESGILVPLQAPGLSPDKDARGLTVDDLDEQARNERSEKLLSILTDEFDFQGTISEGQFKENLTAILDAAPPDTEVALVLSSDKGFNPAGGNVYDFDRGRVLNKWMREVAVRYPFVYFLDMPSMVDDISEMEGQFHYPRIVYYRAFREIERRYAV